MTTSDELAVELRKLFIDRFSLDEMIDLAFNLDPRAGDLGQTTKNGMARELALYVVRRDWVARLINEVGPQERPDIDWKTALPGFASASLLSDDDRRKLIDVLAHTYDMVLGPATRFSLLQRSGVEERAWHINLTGAASEVAERIVADLEPLGILPGKPGYHALGALSDYIRLLPDTDPSEGRVLAEQLIKYQLIADRDYLEQLEATFAQGVTAVRQVDPALLPPSARENEELTIAIANTDEFEHNSLDADLLAGAIYSGQAVGRIESPVGRELGTGFLVGPDLVLTNEVVLPQKALASAVIRFDYYANADGVITRGRVYEILPEIFVSSPSDELNFALVRVKGEPLEARKLMPGEGGFDYLEMLTNRRHRGYLLLSPGSILEGERVNVVHYPWGRPQKIVLTGNSVLADMTAERVRYMIETAPGSSGAPVFNRRWEVIAMHHAGGAHPPIKDPALAEKLRGIKFSEGIPMRAILPLIEQYLPRQ